MFKNQATSRKFNIVFELPVLYSKIRNGQFVEFENGICDSDSPAPKISIIFDFILKNIDELAIIDKSWNEKYIIGFNHEIYYPLGDRFLIDIKDHEKKEEMFLRLKEKLKYNKISFVGERKFIEIII